MNSRLRFRVRALGILGPGACLIFGGCGDPMVVRAEPALATLPVPTPTPAPTAALPSPPPPARLADAGLFGTWQDPGGTGFLALGNTLCVLHFSDLPAFTGAPLASWSEPGLGAARIDLSADMQLVLQRGERIRERALPGSAGTASGKVLEFVETLSMELLRTSAEGTQRVTKRELVSSVSERYALRYAMLNPVAPKPVPLAGPSVVTPEAQLIAAASAYPGHADELIRLRRSGADAATLARCFSKQQAEQLRAALLLLNAASTPAARAAAITECVRREADAQRYAAAVAAWWSG